MSDQFEEVWNRIVNHAGEQFQTRTGQVFRYEVLEGDRIRPTLADVSVSRSELEHYFSEVVGASTGKIAAIASGPSFIWSILTDSRIMEQ